LTVVVRLSGDDVEPVVAAAAQLGVTLHPLHPGVDDPELSAWYVTSPSEDEEATASALQALPGVDSAYPKPPDEPAGEL
jgi:hypothetical protein